MKRTTIIMIALAIGGLLLIEGFIFYVSRYTQPYSTIEANLPRELVSYQLEPFSKLNVDVKYLDIINSSEQCKLIVQQCDTVEAPQLVMQKDLNNYVQLTYSDDTLRMSFVKWDGDSVGKFERRRVFLTAPITFLVPEMPVSVCNEMPFDLVISGKQRGSIDMATQSYICFRDASLDSVIINGSIYMSQWQDDVFFANTSIGYLEVNNYQRPFFVKSDSVSEIDKMVIYGSNNYEQRFTPENLQINDFIFIPANSRSRITLTDYNKFSTSFKR